jgi:hypothetical protein
VVATVVVAAGEVAVAAVAAAVAAVERPLRAFVAEPMAHRELQVLSLILQSPLHMSPSFFGVQGPAHTRFDGFAAFQQFVGSPLVRH